MSERSRDDLERARAKWWVTVSTGDLDGYLALFADDAVWVTPELDEITGRQAIRDWLEPVFAQFDYELTITVADVRIAGDLGIERARFLSRMSPKAPPFRPQLVADPDGAVADAPTREAPTADGGPWGELDTHPAARVRAVDPVAVAADDPEQTEDVAVGDEGDGDGDGGEAPLAEDTAGVDDGDGGAVEAEAVIQPGLRAVADDPDDPDEADPDEADDPDESDEAETDEPTVGQGAEDHDEEPHEGRYLMYWRWHDDAGWLVQRYADVTGVG